MPDEPLDPLYYTKPVEEAAVQGQRNLAGFMKILLVKRLESSFFAFQETLKRFIQSHELVLKALDDGSVYTSKKHSRKLLDFLEAENDEALDRLVEAVKATRSRPRANSNTSARFSM